MRNRFKPSKPAVLAALALSLGLSAAAFAAPPRADAPYQGGPGFHHHGGHHHGFGLGGMLRLHDELKLDARQEALWQDAATFAKESFAGGRERFRKQHDEIAASLKQPGADLRDIVKRMDEQRAEGQKQRDAVRERWLTVYDSLNAEQKEKVRLHLQAGAERHGRFFDKRQGSGPRQAAPERANAPQG